MLHRRFAVTRPYLAWTLGLVLLFSLLGPLPKPAEASHDFCVLDVYGGASDGRDGGPDQPSTGDPTADIHDHNVGDSHTMTARLILVNPSDPFFGVQTCVPNDTVNIDFENEAGANDTDGTTRQSPDLTCSILPSDFAAACTVGYTGNNPGTDIWRAWIDHDSTQTTDESDTQEGVNEITQPGDGGQPGACPGADALEEPDCTDVVQVNWGAGLHSLDCDDSNGPDTERELNPSRAGSASNEVYTCTTRSAFGGLVHGGSGVLTVYGEVEGLSGSTVNDPDPQDGSSYRSPDYRCVISESGPTLGTCQITVIQVENEDGTAEICFWATFKQDPDAPGGAGEDGERACTGSTPPRVFTDQGQESTGEAQGPDKSDVGNDTADQVELSWGVRGANQIDAEPEAQVLEINTQATITATIFDQFGVALENPNRIINFEFFQGSITDRDGNTPQTPDGSCNPNASSTCSFTYNGPAGPGFDLVCVWINTTPTMNGNNTGGNGTCDNEQLNDNDDEINVFDGQGQDDDRDVVQVQWVDPSAATRIDCAPETSSGLPGSGHLVICTATNSQGATVAQTPIDVEAVGANDPDASNTPLSPDFTCITGGDGSCAFQHGPSGTAQNGITTYRAWVDTDNNDSSTEIDAGEPRDETANPGDLPEPDGTDVVERTWGGTVARLSITPKNDTSLIGTCNAYTVTAGDINGVGLAGLVIDVEQRHERANNGVANDEPTVSFCTPQTSDGPNPSNVDPNRGDLHQPSENPDNLGTLGGETEGTTDSQGRITFGISVASGQGSTGAGNVGLIAFYESSDNDDPDPSDPQDPANNLWSTTAATPTSTTTTTTTTTPGPTGGVGSRRVLMSSSKNKVRFRSTYTLNGRIEGTSANTPAPCLQGVTVAIQRDVHGGSQEFVDYGSATTSTGGAFSVNFQADKSANYIARVLENNPPGCGAATSSPETVQVKVRVNLRASRKVVSSGRRVTLKARVKPCEGHENDTIILKRKDGKRPFRKVATTRSNSNCVARFRGRLTKTAKFKAKWKPQDEDHAAGTSRRVRVRVR